MKLTNIGHQTCFPPFVLLLLIAILSLAGIAGCEKGEKPIKLGFSGVLTGRLSDLGTAGRNGVILAVEQVNAEGGINGRAVELIIRDDRQDKEEALRIDRELIDEGVVAIIGHMTSAMSMAAIPLLNKEKILLVSPTTSTNKLTGIDDYFIRVMPPNSAETDHLARYAFKEMGARKIAAICDLSNKAYSEEFINNFRREFEHLGGKVILVEQFTSGKETDFVKLTDSLIRSNPDAVLLVAGALDAAMICQHVRMISSKVLIVSCGWAMTDDFIQHGGPAVEGVVFSQLLNSKSQDKTYLTFKRQFSERFGEEPGFPAIHGYEAARVLFKALSKSYNPEELKATVLQQDTFEGVQGDFKVDKNGDPQRERFLIKVEAGQFQNAHPRD